MKKIIKYLLKYFPTFLFKGREIGTENMVRHFDSKYSTRRQCIFKMWRTINHSNTFLLRHIKLLLIHFLQTVEKRILWNFVFPTLKYFSPLLFVEKKD